MGPTSIRVTDPEPGNVEMSPSSNCKNWGARQRYELLSGWHWLLQFLETRNVNSPGLQSQVIKKHPIGGRYKNWGTKVGKRSLLEDTSALEYRRERAQSITCQCLFPRRVFQQAPICVYYIRCLSLKTTLTSRGVPFTVSLGLISCLWVGPWVRFIQTHPKSGFSDHNSLVGLGTWAPLVFKVRCFGYSFLKHMH